MPSASVFTGLLNGFSDQVRSNRKQLQDETEAQMERDQRIFETLSHSADPDIASGAVQGLLSMNAGTYKPKSGLSQFLGGHPGQNPDVARLVHMLRGMPMEGGGGG